MHVCRQSVISVILVHIWMMDFLRHCYIRYTETHIASDFDYFWHDARSLTSFGKLFQGFFTSIHLIMHGLIRYIICD